jgi:hypothetical protein
MTDHRFPPPPIGIGPLPFVRLRYKVEQLCRLGPWQVREVLWGAKYRIIATCQDQEVADAIVKFMNGDAQGAYSHLRRFHKIGEEEDA